MDFSKIKEELTSRLMANVPDYSKYIDYENVKNPKRLDYDDPSSDEDLAAIKKFKKSEFANAGVGFIIFLAFNVFLFFFVSKIDLSNPDPIAITFIVVFYAIFLAIMLVKPMILFLSKPKITTCEVVGTKVHTSTDSDGSHTTYKAVVAQSSTKRICEVKITHKVYRSLNNEDLAYVVKCGPVYGAVKADL